MSYRAEVADSKRRNQALQIRLNSHSSASPLDLLERNRFRQEFIVQEQHYRQSIQFEDSIHIVLRGHLRRLDQRLINLEIERRAVATSIRHVNLTQEELNMPVPPPQLGQGALSFLTALSDLRNTQNNFTSVWLNYEATRMTLLRVLGIMVTDEDRKCVELSLDQLNAETAEESPLPPPLEVPDNAKSK